MPLVHVASLWSLMGHPSPAKEWSLERKFRAIAAAGFGGLAARLTPEHRRLAEKRGPRHLLGYVSSSDAGEFAAALRVQKEGGAVQINVQMDDHNTPECFFSAAHAAKDLGIAVQLGAEAGLNLPLAAATRAQFDRLVMLGLGRLDKSGVAGLTFKGRPA